MMGFGLAAKGCSGTAWLEIVEKFPGEIDFLAEKGSASIEQCCFRVKIHNHQKDFSLIEMTLVSGHLKINVRNYGVYTMEECRKEKTSELFQ